MTMPVSNQVPPVQVTHHFSASASEVYDAWLDASRAGRWLFATPTGTMKSVEIDARVGGKFQIIETRGGKDATHVGEFFALDRPKRLAFSFGVDPNTPPTTRVTLDIAPTKTGCDVTLSHDGVAADYVDRTAAGWAMILDSLDRVLGEPDAPKN